MSEKIFKPVADVFALIHAGGEPYSWTQDASIAAEWLRDNPKYSVQEFVSLERYQAAITDDLSALQQKLDAVLAENVALKDGIAKCNAAVEHWNSWADAEDKISLHIEAPDTDAILNTVRAEGVQMFVKDYAYKLRTAGGGDGYHHEPYHDMADHIEAKCELFTEKLRADAAKGGSDDK